MSKTQVVKPLIAAMKRRRDCIHQAVETVSKMYENTNPELISQVRFKNGCTMCIVIRDGMAKTSQNVSHAQALENGLIEFFLDLLSSPLTEVEKPSATKALIAESLKAMTKDIANGERVRIHAMHFYYAYPWRPLFVFRRRWQSFWKGPPSGRRTRIRSTTSSSPLIPRLVT